MAEWQSAQEALKYFGLTKIEDLEDLVEDFKIDADISPEGELVAIDAADPQVAEALFELQRRRFGQRPDDPQAQAQAKRRREEEERQSRIRREANRPRFSDRVARRRSLNADS